MRFFIGGIFLIILASCTQPVTEKQELPKTLFSKIPVTHSNIHFSNTVKETLSFNFLNYAYIYNGGGVAVLDINKDGLEDLYFSSNQQSNKLTIAF